MRDAKSLSIAEDRRARIPFAVIGALLLVTSVTVVVAFQVGPAGTQRVDTTQIFQQTKTEIQSEVVAAARQSVTQAGEKPVTRVGDTVAGQAISDSNTFNRYARLRFYLNLERRLDDLEREKSNTAREDVTIRIGVKPVRYNEENISEAIDRVEVSRTDKADDTAVESVQYRLSGDSETIPIVIYRNGHEIARENVPIETSVDSAVYDMHDKSVEFQDRLDSDLQKIMYGALYAVTYTKGGIERVAGNPVMEKFFADIIHKRELHTFADYGVTAIQQGTFDTVAEGVKDETGMNGACLLTYYASRFIAGEFQIYPAPQLLCEVMKRVPEQGGVPSGNNPRGLILNQANRNASIGDAESQLEEVGGLDETTNLKLAEISEVSYANVTGGTYSPENSSGISSSAYENATENYDNFTNEDSTENKPWEGGDFEGKIDDVIEDVYTLDVDAEFAYENTYDRGPNGGTLDPPANQTVVDIGDPVVVFKNHTSVPGLRQRVAVHVPATVNWTVDGETEQKDVTFETVFYVTAKSANSSIQERNIEQPYGNGTNVWGGTRGPSYDDARPEARDIVFPGDDGTPEAMNAALKEEIDTESIESHQDLTEQVEPLITTDGTIEQTEYTTSTERAELRSLLEEQLSEARDEVADIDLETNVTRREMMTKEDVFSNLTVPGSDANRIIYGDYGGGPYDTVTDKAVAAARKRHIDTVNHYVGAAESGRDAVLDQLNAELAGEGGLDKAMDRAENAKDFTLDEYGYTDPGVVSDGDKYVLRTTPDSFTTRSLPQTQGPMIKPRDEVREDEEPIMHTSLASRKITPLPNPGVPIIPWPNFWFVSTNYWNTNVRGEYASFSIEPDIPQTDAAHSQYVRQPQPVSLKINGLHRQVGRVEAINFEVENHIVGVMPGFTPMPKGSLGIGDRVDTLGYMSTCAGAWPKPGPGKKTKGNSGMSLADLGPNPAGEQWNIKNPNFDDSNCPSFNPLLTALTLGTKSLFMATGGGKVDDWMNDYLRKKSGKHRPKKGEFDSKKLGHDIDSGKRMKGTTSSVDGMSKKIGKNLMAGLPLAMGTAEVVGLQILAQNPKYAQQVTCPAIPDEEGQSGCDDDRLEVEVFDSDDTSSITIVESERAAKGTDRVLAIDTSDGEPLPDSWRCIREEENTLWKFGLIVDDRWWQPHEGDDCQGGDLTYNDIVYTPQVNCFVGETTEAQPHDDHPSGRVPLAYRNDGDAVGQLYVLNDCTSIFTDGYDEIDKNRRAWLYTGPKLDITDGTIPMERIEERIVADTDLNDLVLDDESGRVGLIDNDVLYLQPHDFLVTKGELEAAGAYDNLERREEPNKTLRGNESIERPFHRVVARPEGKDFATVNMSTSNNTELLSESPALPVWADDTDPAEKPRISKPADDQNGYVRTITYKDHTFLIAVGDGDVDWNAVRGQVESIDGFDVDVLITSEHGYEALGETVDPKSITVTSDISPASLSCPDGGDSATGIYVGGSDSGTKYTVSEEGDLFGPESSPDIQCAA